MSIEDRDWYRADFKRRRASAESSARPGWDDIERPSLSAGQNDWGTGLRFGPLGWLIVIAICVVTADNQGYLRRASWSRFEPASAQGPSPPYPTVAFPVDGSTTMFVPVDLATLAPLTLQTPATSPPDRYVVSVRDWSTDQAAATVYLEANTVVTVDLPAGHYRVLVASGQQWRGEQLLFGPSTQVGQARDPIDLQRYGTHAVGQTLYLMPGSNARFRMDQVPMARFSTR